MRLRYVVEEEPLGTAGPGAARARRGAARGAPARAERRRAHRHRPDRRAGGSTRHAARARRWRSRRWRTRRATAWCPPTPRAAWRRSSRRRTGQAPTNRINAGAYVLEREVIEARSRPGRAVSFEREVFPALVGDGALRLRRGRATGSTSGRPSATSRPPGTCSRGRVRLDPAAPRRDRARWCYDGCLLAGAHVGRRACSGRSCSVGTDARVERSVLHDRVQRGRRRRVRETVLAERVRVGERARVGPGAMVGAGASIGEGATVGEGARRSGRRGRAGELVGGPWRADERSTRCRAAVAAVDPHGMLDDVLAQPLQLATRSGARSRPASAPRDLPGGLVVCGMGGSAIGGDLAVAALGDRATRPIADRARLRARALDPARHARALLELLGRAPRRRSPASRRPARPARARVVLTTGGALAEAARAEGVPVIGVPAGMQPRAAVLYMTVGALECAAAVRRRAGAARGDRGRHGAARAAGGGLGPGRRRRLAGQARSPTRCTGTLPVIHGAGPTAAPARRWNTQLNENAKSAAFASRAAGGQPQRDLRLGARGRRSRPLAAVFLEDPDQHPRVRRRIELTAEEVERRGRAGDPRAGARARAGSSGCSRSCCSATS